MKITIHTLKWRGDRPYGGGEGEPDATLHCLAEIDGQFVECVTDATIETRQDFTLVTLRLFGDVQVVSHTEEEWNQLGSNVSAAAEKVPVPVAVPAGFSLELGNRLLGEFGKDWVYEKKKEHVLVNGNDELVASAPVGDLVVVDSSVPVAVATERHGRHGVDWIYGVDWIHGTPASPGDVVAAAERSWPSGGVMPAGVPATGDDLSSPNVMKFG